MIASGIPADLKRQVGGHTVVLRPADVGDLDAAAAGVARVTGREPSRSHRHELVARVVGDAEFFHIAARLRELDIDVGEFAFRLPSFDEVFLCLTGATATDHAAEEAA
ncbi:hypothetical protein ACQEU8_00870 [Streptomyces sp. CA-250714]|uniref:hypothetical protein n=1 Tax=Streptomyces sp. CA-250714 TaxID=3240060 RepID=UPI003D933EC9